MDKDSYLLELSRYVVFNPVRARIVAQPGQWQWSSYRAMVGEESSPKWLATDELLAQFGGKRAVARRYFREFVAAGVSTGSVWAGLRQQLYSGDEAFVDRSQKKAKVGGDELSMPRAQRRSPAMPLKAITRQHNDRDMAIAATYATGVYRYRETAEHFGLHLATVGRIVRRQMLQGEN